MEIHTYLIKVLFTFHMLMKNCSLALMCESSTHPLCTPPFDVHANVGDNIHNNSHEGISMAITTLLKSHNVPTTPPNVVNQVEILGWRAMFQQLNVIFIGQLIQQE
jgi:hypothetical protein